MDIVSVVKAHPLPIIGGAVVILLLVSMRGSSSGSSGSGAGVALESQRIATAANVQVAGINAQAATARGEQQMNIFAAQLSENGKQALARTDMMATLFSTNIQASTALEMDQNKNFTTRMLGQLNSQDNQLQMANALTLGTRTIEAGIKTSSDKLAADIEMNNSNNNAKLNGLARTIQGGIDMAYIDSNMQLSKTQTAANLSVYQTDVTARNLPTLLQHSENQARVAAANAQALATISGTTAQILSANATKAANTAADANANKSNSEAAGGWVKTIGSIASLFF